MFKNGKATYTNQFIPSPRYNIERQLGEEFFPNVGEYKGVLGLMKLSFHPQLVKEKLDDDMMKVVLARLLICYILTFHLSKYCTISHLFVMYKPTQLRWHLQTPIL